LFTASEFHGRDLKERGIVMPVVPRDVVLDRALALAHWLAQSGRDELVRAKRQRSRHLQDRLPAVFAQELAMHSRTFVGSSEVGANIDRYFGGGERHGETAPEVHNEAAGAPLLDVLRQSLADELQIPHQDLDDTDSFVDIGIDSISAVT